MCLTTIDLLIEHNYRPIQVHVTTGNYTFFFKSDGSAITSASGPQITVNLFEGPVGFENCDWIFQDDLLSNNLSNHLVFINLALAMTPFYFIDK